MAGNLTRSIRLRKGRESGMSLIEIVIALFVFMLGVLGIFAILPVAMHHSAQAVRTNRGGVVAQFALATAQYQMSSPHYRGFVAVAGANTLEDSETPGWTVDQWVPTLDAYEAQWGYHVSIVDGVGIGQARRIAGNAATQLTVAANWSPVVPNDTSRYRIATFAVDARHPNVTEGPRGGFVSGIESASANPHQLPVDKTYSGKPSGTFFVLITSGRAAGRVCELTDASGNTIQGPAGFHFYNDGVRDGDSYYLIGNGSGIASYPTNFASPLQDAGSGRWRPQTLPDPSTAAATEYSYAIVVSDTSDMPGGAVVAPERVDTLVAPVRVDVLVFRNYDDSKTPAQNKRAVAFQTAYLPAY